MTDSHAPRSRRDRYRSIVDTFDPDLPPGPAVPDEPAENYTHPTAVLLTRASQRVDGLRRLAPDGSVEVTPPLSRKALVLRIQCGGPGCGVSAKGAKLAEIWRVPDYGLLFRAKVPHARDTRRFPDLHPDACVMVHAGLEQERNSPAGTWSTASWTTERALAMWESRGWGRAPAGVEPVETWQPGRFSLVRDLLDRDDAVHVPLRVCCSRHGPRLLDRGRLLEEVRRATRPRVVRVDAVCTR